MSEFYWGVIRIRNPKTLHKWVKCGWHQEMVDAGYQFNFGCGRYRDHKCECSKCRKEKNSPLREILKLKSHD